ncbi:hypothetical protein [Streptomyces gibsoniae]|uniref:Uncharacterized protein n=1 Tax=Streptomyces gibsoniae TaxID=3075529 RepID=A0ABU2U9D5_9ACTN|nr:hypothetical protein [Streptomyces sp. DSM 41699]MDT0469852.1 hypothetical protein [Streptomyces sp. DSM 41699]
MAICLDNISIIPDRLSDALCRAVTGDRVVDRTLSLTTRWFLEYRRVLAMATIDTGALADGLAERLLTIELQLIPDPKCREEADLDRAPEEADSPPAQRPYILRHAGISFRLSSGADPAEVARRAGDYLVPFRVYANVLAQPQERANRRIEATLQKWGEETRDYR